MRRFFLLVVLLLALPLSFAGLRAVLLVSLCGCVYYLVLCMYTNICQSCIMPLVCPFPCIMVWFWVISWVAMHAADPHLHSHIHSVTRVVPTACSAAAAAAALRLHNHQASLNACPSHFLCVWNKWASLQHPHWLGRQSSLRNCASPASAVIAGSPTYSKHTMRSCTFCVLPFHCRRPDND
jgi:hypothetical protein